MKITMLVDFNYTEKANKYAKLCLQGQQPVHSLVVQTPIADPVPRGGSTYEYVLTLVPKPGTPMAKIYKDFDVLKADPLKSFRVEDVKLFPECSEYHECKPTFDYCPHQFNYKETSDGRRTYWKCGAKSPDFDPEKYKCHEPECKKMQMQQRACVVEEILDQRLEAKHYCFNCRARVQTHWCINPRS